MDGESRYQVMIRGVQARSLRRTAMRMGKMYEDSKAQCFIVSFSHATLLIFWDIVFAHLELPLIQNGLTNIVSLFFVVLQKYSV